MTSRILVSIRVPATPQRTFEAFVDEIDQWWQPNPIFRFTARRPPGRLAFEPGLGGSLVERLVDGTEFEIGRVTIWQPSERLGFTWRQESFADGQCTRVEVRFEPVGDETRVTVEHLGWEQVPQDHVARHRFPDPVFMVRHGEWWQTLLTALREHIDPA